MLNLDSNIKRTAAQFPANIKKLRYDSNGCL